MDCNTFQDSIPDAVDNRLDGTQQSEFALHAGVCPECRNEFETESLTKGLVRSRIRMVRTPSSVLTRLTDEIAREHNRSDRSLQGRIRSVVSSWYVRPAIAFAAACVAIIFLLSPDPDSSFVQKASLIPGDILHESLTNYFAVAKGDISPQFTSDRIDQMQSFFTGKTTFPVRVPSMRDCRLVGGGIVARTRGINLAHVVYRDMSNSEMVYIYQACWNEVQKGKDVHIPEEAMKSLAETQWYSTTRPDGYSIVLWQDGRTLCSAVAKMRSDELIACLQNLDSP